MEIFVIVYLFMAAAEITKRVIMTSFMKVGQVEDTVHELEQRRMANRDRSTNRTKTA